MERPDLRAQGYVPGTVVITTNAAATTIYETDVWVLDMYGQQHFGGWRIGLWEDAAVGMNVSVSFSGAALATLVGNVAEYKKSSVQDSVSDAEWGAFKRLFQSNALSRCVHGSEFMDVPMGAVNGAMQMGMLSDLFQYGAGKLGNLVEGQVGKALGMGMQHSAYARKMQMAGMSLPSNYLQNMRNE